MLLLSYDGLTPLLLKTGKLLLIAVLLFYLLNLLFNALAFNSKKHKIYADYRIALNILLSLIVLMFFVSAFFMLMIKTNGIDVFLFSQFPFCYAAVPMLLLYGLPIALFILIYTQITKSLKQ